MANEKWTLKGIYYETCRANGNCPLTFGRDMIDGPCVNLATYQVTEGQIEGVDMKEALFTIHADGIGPKFTDLFPGQKGIAEIAIYLNESTNDEQKQILESFLKTHLSGAMTRKILGVKTAAIEIKEESNKFIISSPFFKQDMTVAFGGDMKNPIVIQNPITRFLKDFKVYNGKWSYTDFGKSLEYQQTSGVVADFFFSGN